MNQRRQIAGFTLIELLVVIGIIGILAGLIMPSLGRSMRQAKRIQCANNLRQIGIAFQQFADLNRNRYPMQLLEFSTATNTAAEFLELTAVPFQETAQELASPRLLVCAADAARQPAESFSTLTDDNISYVVSTIARPGDATTMVATDRNVVRSSPDEGEPGSGGRIEYGKDLHDLRGNVLMGDGRVEWAGGVEWTRPPVANPLPTNTVAVKNPVVEVRPGEGAAPHVPPVSTSTKFNQTTAVPDSTRAEPPAPEIVETGTNIVVQTQSPPREPPPVFSLIPAGDGSPQAGRNWWWLLLLLLAAVIFWLLRSRGRRDPSIGRMTEFYTGAAINADAMLATLAENHIATRWEYVHAKQREHEDENTRPMRIFVNKSEVETANQLFSGEQSE